MPNYSSFYRLEHVYHRLEHKFHRVERIFHKTERKTSQGNVTFFSQHHRLSTLKFAQIKQNKLTCRLLFVNL